MDYKNHKDLCKLACVWLQRGKAQYSHGCEFAVSEVGNGHEIADAIGFKDIPDHSLGYNSVLIEVKVSRSDFLADSKKKHRVYGANSLGDLRYYMVPEGLIKPDEVPYGWGLLYVNERGHVLPQKGVAKIYKDMYKKVNTNDKGKDYLNPNSDKHGEWYILTHINKRISSWQTNSRHDSWRETFRENKKLRKSTSEIVRTLKRRVKTLEQKLSKNKDPK